MALTALAIILLSLLLLWSGAVQPWFCYLAVIAGLAAFLFESGLFIYHHLLLRREGEGVKAKWGGIFWHGAGLQLLPTMTVMLFITRKDEMYFKAEEYEQSVSLKSVRKILSIRSDQLRRHGDPEICALLGADKLPALHLIRAQINRFSRFRRLPLLLILLEDEKQEAARHQLLALYARHSGSVMNSFLGRPEIREKAVPFSAEKAQISENKNSMKNTEVIS